MAEDQVDAKKAVGFVHTPVQVSYNSRDAILYALGVGATDLKFVYELHEDFSILPTYPVVLQFKENSSDVVSFPPASMLEMPPGIPIFNPAMILHGEQYLEILDPLPSSGSFVLHGKTVGVHDKGKGTLMEVEQTMVDSTGKPIAKLVTGSFIRGLNGFESAGTTYSQSISIPSRSPDAVEKSSTSENQALLYRLSGDYNPLHADPDIASSVGFEKPILHGLCTFGYAARAVLKAMCGNDAKLFKAIKVRFARPVYPGETLVTSMWREGNRIIFETKVEERDEVVINNAYVELRGSNSGPQSESSLASDPIFQQIKDRVQTDGQNFVNKIKAIVQFNITRDGNTCASWVLNLKSGNGSVERDIPCDKPDISVTLSDDVMVLLSQGKLNPQQAFMQGKLKVKGNMALAMKLGSIIEAAR